MHKESLRHGALRAGQVACRITAAEEGRGLLQLVKKDFANYLAVGKLMAVKYVQSQSCDFYFSTIHLDNSKGFDGAVEKVTADLKMWK